MDEFTRLLEEASKLNQKKLDAIEAIRNTRFKKYGLTLVEISDDEKVRMYNKTQETFGKQIDAVYQELNAKLIAAGESEMQNPYKERKIEKWN